MYGEKKLSNKNIIIILIVIIIILAAALGILFMQPSNAKEATKIKVTSNKTLTEGDDISVQLTDSNKTPLSKQNVKVTVKNGKGKVVLNKTVKTNSKGKAKIDSNLKKGKYKVKVSYKGNKNYTGNNTTQNLTIKEKVKKPLANPPVQILRVGLKLILVVTPDQALLYIMMEMAINM